MIYRTAQDWLDSDRRRVLLFGMSGLGKTHISSILRNSGGWFHYSIDYRIGTRYMDEHIVDNFKRAAMREPFLRELLVSDSIYIASNLTFDNLAPLSTYLGRPGDPEKGGLPFEEYLHRQEQHREAEIASLLDSVRFVHKAKDIYDYDHFVCDSGGSICEVVDPDDPEDPVLSELVQHLLLVWIEGKETHTQELVRRFDRAPKPMYYQPEFLKQAWASYLQQAGESADKVDPDAFVRWTYARALAHRTPRYAAMAERWGLRVPAEEAAKVNDADAFVRLIADALEARA